MLCFVFLGSKSMGTNEAPVVYVPVLARLLWWRDYITKARVSHCDVCRTATVLRR